MLRGGRSWPSERKLGAGARRDGNVVAAGSFNSGTPATSRTNGVAEQDAEHRLHLSECDLPWSWPPSWPAPWSWTAWSWTLACSCTASAWSWWDTSASTWTVSVDTGAPAGAQAMATAIAPRTGSNTASRTRSQTRRSFTGKAYQMDSDESYTGDSLGIVNLATGVRSSAGAGSGANCCALVRPTKPDAGVFQAATPCAHHAFDDCRRQAQVTLTCR